MNRRALALATVGALALTGCSSDDAVVEDTAPEPVATSEEPAADPTPEAMEPQEYAVTGTDYSYAGIPAEAAVGSSFTFSNGSTAEVHELVALNVGADDRPLFDILTEMQAAFEAGQSDQFEPALVIIEAPGGDPHIPAVGDGTLTEPGRYIFLCAIQQGVAPADYFAELARMQEAGEGGAVNIEGAGGPHAALGMVAETRIS